MFLLKEPGYDAVKDFAPLCGVGAFEHAFVVRNDLPAKSIAELVALAKADPGKLNYGSTGVGSGSHLAMELFMQRTGIKMTHVPFRGAAPLVQEIVGGRIDIANSTLPSVLEQIKAGIDARHRAGQPRAQSARQGHPDAARAGRQQCRRRFLGRLLRAGRDARAGARHAVEGDDGLASPSRPSPKPILKLGFTLKVRDPAAFKPYHQQEIATWKGIIEAAGVKPE